MDATGHNVRRQDKIQRPAWERIVRAADQVLRHDSYLDAGAITASTRAPNTILVRNSGSDALGRHAVAAITGVLTPASGDDYKARPIATVDYPPSTVCSWGVTVDPIKHGEIGRLAIGGVVPLLVDMALGSGVGTHALAVPGVSANGKAGFGVGARIVYATPGTGTQLCLVQLGIEASGIRLGKTSSAWTKGTSASIQTWDETPDGEEVSGNSVTVYNRFANIGSGKWVAFAAAANGRYYLISAECS